MMSALKPLLSLIKAPFYQSGHARASSPGTKFVTAQARDPIRAAMPTEIAALGNGDKENL